MKELLLIIHILASMGLILLVLLQQGKGADMGAAFGAGASQTLFGARGAATFLSRVTKVFAVIFFCTSLGLTYWYTHHATPKSVMEQVGLPPEAPPAVPGTPAPAQAPAAPALPEVPR